MILLISFCYDSVPNHLAEGWKAEVSEGGFVPYSRGKREPSEKPEHVEGEEDMDESMDEEAERDVEGADTSSLLSCPVEGCIRTYQKYHNLERHLLFGKCKLVSEKYNLLDTAKLAYVERVQECSTIQPTLAVPTTTEVSCPLVQGWALKGTKKATRLTRISVSTSIASSRLDRRVAIKPTLRRCHGTCAMLGGTAVRGASTWKSS